MEENSKWLNPPDSLSLSVGEVHVWRIGLDQADELLKHFQGTLDPDETDRANRFRFEKHRRHFVIEHGFLRDVLGRYLQVRPGELSFSFNAYGKPVLTDHESLRFNMSHSHELAVVAVARDKELGVDVEHIRADFASEDIAKRFFSRNEVESFNGLPKEDQVAAFFRCWSRKEAYIKAIGKGLSQPLEGFDVTLAPGEPAALLRADVEDKLIWTLTDIDVGPDYASALAAEGTVSEMFCWRYVRQDLQDYPVHPV